MTQIISLGTPRYVLQVSDRLVSKRESRKFGPHDPRFNKHVLFGARDAIVTVGFTGLAYLANVPTDQWIAAMLAGEQPATPQGGPSRGTRIQTAPANWPDIGIAIQNLRAHLGDLFRRLNTEQREAGLTLTIIGWQWKRRGANQIRRMRPILINLFYEPNAVTFLTQSAPRYWGWEKNGSGIKAAPALPKANFDEIVSLLQSPPGNMLTDEVAESILIEAIRELAAAPDRGIGQDLLSVSINVYRDPVVKVRYHPVSASELYYTGWIVTSSIIQPPQIATMSAGMSHEMQAGLFGISFEGPSAPLPGGSNASSADQRREKPPRR